MNSPDLLSVCGSAFLAVFLLLIILAVVMRVITMLFPEKGTAADEAIVAAITTAAGTMYPGTKVTKIEEIK